MLVVAGCSTEPTTADELQALQQEPAIADQQIAETERDLVRAEAETEAVTVIDTPPIKAT